MFREVELEFKTACIVENSGLLTQTSRSADHLKHPFAKKNAPEQGAPKSNCRELSVLVAQRGGRCNEPPRLLIHVRVVVVDLNISSTASTRNNHKLHKIALEKVHCTTFLLHMESNKNSNLPNAKQTRHPASEAMLTEERLW